MKPNYDALTPAQKAKLTRLSNRLDDQKRGAFQIQLENYQKKQKAVQEVSEPIIQEMNAQATEKMLSLREQIHALQDEIEALRKDNSAAIGAIRDEYRKEYEAEWNAYLQAIDLANEWRANKWKELSREMWREFGFDVEEKQEQKTA